MLIILSNTLRLNGARDREETWMLQIAADPTALRYRFGT